MLAAEARLERVERMSAQARFWKAVAEACAKSPAVFCYDLMNEPILPGKKIEAEWLTRELGGKHFVQRLSLDLKDRSREQVALGLPANTGADSVGSRVVSQTYSP